MELIRVQMYKVPGLRAGQSIHHKVDHSKVVVPNKLDLSKVDLNKVDLNKAHLNKVDFNKTHLNKMDPSRVDQCKAGLNR